MVLCYYTHTISCHMMSISVGISEKIEDAKDIRLKRRSEIDQNLRDQIEHSDVILSKLCQLELHWINV